MVDRIAFVRIKCGQIFFLSDDKFSWACEFCDKDFYSLEDFRPHINEHFPKSLTNIKRENSISCGSDFEAFPLDIGDVTKKDSCFDNENCLPKTPLRIKKENSIGFDSECEYFQPEIRDDVMSFEDIMKYEADTQLVNEKCGSSRLADNHFKEKTMKSEPGRKKSSKQSLSNVNAYNNTEIPCRPAKSRKMTFECSFCKKPFRDGKELNDHENTHTGKRPHRCQICSTTFASVSNMRRHVKVHKDDRRHQCKVCKKRFVVRSKLDIHVREKHLPDTDARRYFPCELCDAKFKSYAQLYIHRRIHREHTAVFACYYCKKEFPRREFIVLHMKIHSSNNP